MGGTEESLDTSRGGGVAGAKAFTLGGWVGGFELGNVREMSGTKQRQWKHITYVLYLIYRKMGTGKVAMIVYRGIPFLNNY